MFKIVSELLYRNPFSDSGEAADYMQRAEKIMRRVKELSLVSEEKNAITRTFGTNAFVVGSNKVLSWMKQAGLQTRIDNIGNVRGRLISNNPGAKTLVIASHIDTVVNAGKFDGPLGVIMGLDTIENIIQHHVSLPFHIELVAFSDEEGVRFHTTYLGSRVVAGSFNNQLLEMKDEQGITLKEVLIDMGCDINALQLDAIKKEDWLGYYEIHIEQGPVLYDHKIPVAVVTAIAGQQRAEITFKGMAGHAGTVPMEMRSDALCAAAEFIVEVEKFALANKSNIVATVGKLNIPAAASNVIPGTVVLSVDLRSATDTVLTAAHQSVKKLCSDICSKRKLAFEWKPIQQMNAVKCDEKLMMLQKQAVIEGCCQLVELVSGAGHDAVPVSQVAPVSMLFVRCYKGISHNPLENVELEDIAAAAEVTDHFIEQLRMAK
ncbi:MAG: allantoate amidohydrolase [Bacteroidota bacterium]